MPKIMLNGKDYSAPVSATILPIAKELERECLFQGELEFSSSTYGIGIDLSIDLPTNTGLFNEEALENLLNAAKTNDSSAGNLVGIKIMLSGHEMFHLIPISAFIAPNLAYGDGDIFEYTYMDKINGKVSRVVDIALSGQYEKLNFLISSFRHLISGGVAYDIGWNLTLKEIWFYPNQVFFDGK